MRTTVTVALFESGADALRLDHLGRQLRSDLVQLRDVDDVALGGAGGAGGAADQAPPGTRGIDAATASTLAVAVFGSGGVSALIGALRQWLARGGSDAGRSVRVEVDGDVLEVKGATREEQDRLIEVFLRRVEERQGS